MSENPPETEAKERRRIFFDCVLLFSVSFPFLFLGMSRSPNTYDEGLTLTAAMRILAGQVPHRDFYAIYGPAEFYGYALLFKLFGPSILVARLFGLFVQASTITLVYRIASLHCRRIIALGAASVMLVWLYSMGIPPPVAVIPVAFLNLLSSMLILPVFTRDVSWKRMAAAGGLAGLAGLYRYDTGIALLGMQTFLMAVAVYVRPDATLPSTTRPAAQASIRRFASVFWPYLVAFVAVTVPPALYYLSLAPLHPLIYDVVIFQSKFYHRSRNLPFPGFHRDSLGELGVYIPILTLAISFFVLMNRAIESRRKARHGELSNQHERAWEGFLLVFSVLALIMYFKGIIRITLGGVYLSILPSILLLAVLLQKRKLFSRFIRISILSVSALTLVLVVLADIRYATDSLAQRSVPGRILRVLFFPHRAFPGVQETWCKEINPVTKGFCFLPDEGRVNAIDFIESHTRPDQPLFVGNVRHDKVFANDNLIYFATQRLPATEWSHFDPHLQNSAEIQTEMIQELDAHAPPYIVLDAEFEKVNEPNDSSKSTGVTLLDNYIHSKYQQVETFDEMAIWQRLPAPSK